LIDVVEPGRMLPPTVAHLKSMGVSAFNVTCAHAYCLHSASLTFAAAGVEDRTPFPLIAERHRFVCTRCGSRAVSIMPDWRGHKASGIGGR
jgi:hypothetical protein